MSNTAKYREWMANVDGDGYGKCAETTIAMQEAFPELARVRGFYHCPLWGQRAHWWLVTPDGAIVDPTAMQFPSGGLGLYVRWPEGQPEPTGKCPNCSDYCYNDRTCCSEPCSREYAAYCMGGVM